MNHWLLDRRPWLHVGVVVVSTIGSVAGGQSIGTSVAAQQNFSAAALQARGELSSVLQSSKPSGPNPYLAFLPVGTTPDYQAWNEWLGRVGVAKRAALGARAVPRQVLLSESEPNDTQVTADFLVGFGTGLGDDPEAEVAGVLPATSTDVIGPFAEDDGSIPLANPTGLLDGGEVLLSATLGDGPHGSAGSGSGDFDFYSVSGVSQGDVIVIDIDAPIFSWDSVVTVWSSAGELLREGDDSLSGRDSFLIFLAPTTDTYFVSVGAFGSAAPVDPFDSASGLGVASEGDYDLRISLNLGNVDFFSFDLDAGDIIAANVFGTNMALSLYDPSGGLRMAAAFDVQGILPGPFPSGGDAAFAYVAETAGTYAVRVTGGEGGYTLELQVWRPPLETAPNGAVQTIFVDFDGATLNPGIFGVSSGTANLSPLSAFLSAWGLASVDESAVIDAIMASIEESLSTDLRVLGANGDFDVSAIPGDFDVVLLNSRDHADPFGAPYVSRLIIGGTVAELGIATLGIAESIDVGNFEHAESAVVLLDFLSTIASNPNSLNQYSLAGGATKVDLVGTGVGNIAAHEAGHLLANFHTENTNSSANIMDRGGNLANLVGVGDDMVFGSADDVDVDFGPDEYSIAEGLFYGTEDTLNAIAFGMSTAVPPLSDCPPVADGECVSGFAKGFLRIKEGIVGRERLSIKMSGGPALLQTDFGNPLMSQGTAYGVCIYDDVGQLSGAATVDRAGDLCFGRPCWKSVGKDPPDGKGFRYKDRGRNADGIETILYKGGPAGGSSLKVKGRGTDLPTGIAAALESSTSATVQLRPLDAACFTVTMDEIRKQDSDVFKAKGSGPLPVP